MLGARYKVHGWGFCFRVELISYRVWAMVGADTGRVEQPSLARGIHTEEASDLMEPL